MKMSDLTFPAFNFPYTSSVSLQQSLCDYGRDELLAVFKDDHGSLTYVPQRKKAKSNRSFKFRAKKPSLPLKLPTNVCHKFQFDNVSEKKKHCSPLSNFRKKNMVYLTENCDGILFEGFLEALGDEVCSLWSGGSRVNGGKDVCTTMLDDLFCDIPIPILNDLLDQSHDLETFILDGGYYSDCLNYQYIRNDDVIMVYPSGTHMDQLCSSLASFSEDRLTLSLNHDTDVHKFPNKIYQISLMNDFNVNPLIAVRSHYSCGIFACEFDQTSKVPSLKNLGNLSCKTQPCSVLVNPYISGEIAVVMETGSVHLWHEQSSTVEVLKAAKACQPEEFKWYFSEFATNPRQVIRGSATTLELIDFRTSSGIDKELLSLPSSHFFNDDQLSTVQRHPGNPYHYFAGSKQFLVVMDERFEQTPVLKWCHSLVGPVKHINVIPNASPCTKDTLLVVGDYKNHELHSYQYSYGEQIPHGHTVMSTKGGMPAQPSGNPWKISSYTEWPDVLDIPGKTEYMSALRKKLDVPLIGLATVRHQDNLTILQLSNEGDIFYQTLVPEITNLVEERHIDRVLYYEEKNNNKLVNFDRTRLKLSASEENLLKQWIHIIEHQCLKSNICAVKESEHSIFDFDAVRQELLLQSSVPSSCQLCCIPQTTDCKMKSTLCCHCVIDENISGKLTEIVGSDGPVLFTNTYLEIPCPKRELRLFDLTAQYVDPLGKVLLKNWDSDEPTPIDLTNTEAEEPTSMLDKQTMNIVEAHETSNSKIQNVEKSTETTEYGNLSQNMLNSSKNIPSRITGI